jgi:hypothetical protein
MNEPTPEQAKRLELITNPTQRRALEAAIAGGEDIPEIAWTPVPDITAEQQAIIDQAARELVAKYGSRAAHVVASIDLDDDESSADHPTD